MAAANSIKTARVPGRPFQKGQSGNPRGRPKRTKEQKDALAMIRDMAPEAAEQLKNILQDPDTKTTDKLRAIELIFDRAFGKAYATEAIDNTLATAREILGGVRSVIQ